MVEITHHNYRELTPGQVELYAPSAPGVYLLAVRLANGVHQSFHTGTTGNLRETLSRYAGKRNDIATPVILEHLEKFQCYFTYAVIYESKYREELHGALAV